jgi:MFS superfamily sulfate permease-like transporter
MNATATVWLPILVLVAALIFWGYCLLDFMQTDEREIRTLSRPVWLVILIFGSVVGGLLWLSTGRPQDRRRR